MDTNKEIIQQWEDWLFEWNSEIVKLEEVWELNEESLNKGDALRTPLAIASHQSMKEVIERKKKEYYKIEAKIEELKTISN